MPFIDIPDGDEPNHIRALDARPDVRAAWQQLNGAIKANMDQRRYELVTLAAARRLRSSYCSLAHARVLIEEGVMEPDAVRAAYNARAGLSDVDVACMELAEKLVADATSISEGDIERLTSLGLSDADVVDVITAAAARCFYSKTLDALGVQPDASFQDFEPGLREALVVGRPIEDAE